MKKKPKNREIVPNCAVGIVIETEVRFDFITHSARGSMTVQWMDGTKSENVPMVVIAFPGDRFDFTITPA